MYLVHLVNMYYFWNLLLRVWFRHSINVYYVLLVVCMTDFSSYLFSNAMPLLVTHAHIHTLLMEEFTLLWHQEDVTHEFTNWNKNNTSRWQSSVSTVQLICRNNADRRTFSIQQRIANLRPQNTIRLNNSSTRGLLNFIMSVLQIGQVTSEQTSGQYQETEQRSDSYGPPHTEWERPHSSTLKTESIAVSLYDNRGTELKRFWINI